jgi:hypothetical protein
MLEEMFIGIVKNSVLKMIENEFSKAEKEWIDKWINGEISTLDTFVKENVKEIKLFKGIAVKVCLSMKEDEILEAIKIARPDLKDLWETIPVKDRIHTEWMEITKHVENM